MYVYICIYDKRQREIEIEKTNEQKKGVQEKKMKKRPSSGHGAHRQKKIRLFLNVCLYACDQLFSLRTISIIDT